ncbi:MAG: hypothetical protein KatS3mg033_1297 [Thermonema sp.]|jgi:hypothetical protein|uniref:hypothetical protein n=1 Tax=Thermonema TaxID=28194 RepID=UPI00056FDCB0|nr:MULTISPECIES: hypothetical protein [Thermonema]GIV39497.1 MAG: hypothetical protein KatS3mg033_1297 [Thermonema sp.]
MINITKAGNARRAILNMIEPYMQENYFHLHAVPLRRIMSILEEVKREDEVVSKAKRELSFLGMLTVALFILALIIIGVYPIDKDMEGFTLVMFPLASSAVICLILYVSLSWSVYKSLGFNYLLMLYAYDFLSHFRHELNQEAPAGLQVYTDFYDSPDLEKEKQRADGYNITKYFISPAVKLEASFTDGSKLVACLNAYPIVMMGYKKETKHRLLFVHEVTLNTTDGWKYEIASEDRSKEVTLSKEEEIKVPKRPNQYFLFISTLPSAEYAIELTLKAREKQKAAQ